MLLAKPCHTQAAKLKAPRALAPSQGCKVAREQPKGMKRLRKPWPTGSGPNPLTDSIDLHGLI